MIKKSGFLTLFICLLMLLSPLPVQAQGGPIVQQNSAQVDFPLYLHFNLAAESDANITDIRLHYIVDQTSFAQVVSEVYIDFTPATSVEVSWTFDLRRIGGLPTGSSVEYWWAVTDANAAQVVTSPALVQFNDLRNAWQSLTEGMVTLYWYQGKESFARELMATAQQTLDRLAEDTGAYLEKPVNLYIYGSSRDLRGAMIFPQEWTGGVAFPRFGTIAIGIAPGELDWGRRAIAHELAHLVVHQVTLNPYNDIPVWLDEGLAMYAEGEPESRLLSLLNKAITENRVTSVRSLSSPFSADAQEANIAYAQSYSLVEFLISRYGQAKMLELLDTFGQGSNYDEALMKVYGFDMDGLNKRWLDYMTASAGVGEQAGLVPKPIKASAGLVTSPLLCLVEGNWRSRLWTSMF